MRRLIHSPLPKEDCPVPVSRHLILTREHYQKNSFGQSPAKRSRGSVRRGGRRVTRGNHHTCSGNSTESESTESENSYKPRARTQAVFWAGAVCGVWDVRGSFDRGDIMLRM